MLKNRAQKSKNILKITPKWIPKNEGIFREMPLGTPLVVQTVCVMKKLPPSAPKVLPMIENEIKMTPENPANVKKSFKKNPENEKELQK